MAPIQNAKAARGRLDSGDASNDSPEAGRDGRVDTAPSWVARRLSGAFQGQNMTEAAIMDKSGKSAPNIGHFPEIR
jgi:hypothetical protein